jgi:hypothetical protein
MPPIDELSTPMLRPAGMRINPATNGPAGGGATLTGYRLRSLTDGSEVVVRTPAGSLGPARWFPDGAGGSPSPARTTIASSSGSPAPQSPQPWLRQRGWDHAPDGPIQVGGS